ncbi:MAG: hypothetical protein Q8L27_01065 [archaeon]|nr:hypothetical protein [archaeon]
MAWKDLFRYFRKPEPKRELTKDELEEEKRHRRYYHEDRVGWMRRDWYKQAIPILIEIFKSNPKKLKGITFSRYTNPPDYVQKVIVMPRNDGRFNVKAYSKCLVAEDTKDYGLDTNNHRGYTAEDLFTKWPSEHGFNSFFPTEYFPQNRDYLIKEIKKRIGIDLRKEVKERVKRKTLEGNVLGIIGILGFVLTFLSGFNITGNSVTNYFSAVNYLSIIGLLIGIFGLTFFINSRL